MREDMPTLRPNRYPNGPYQDSTCIHCLQPVRHTGAWSGVTWEPTAMPPNGRPRDWWTCWGNEVKPNAFGGHEPWEAIPIAKEAS